MLDWIIGLCHITAEIHFPGMSCSTSECTKWNAAVADRDEVCKNSNPKAQHGETRIYILKEVLKMNASKIVKEWKYWVLRWLLWGTEPGLPRWEFDTTTTMLPITAVLEIIAMSYSYMGWKCCKVWAPKLVIKVEKKTKQKHGGIGVGNTTKMAWNVGSVNDEKRSCGEVKNFQCCCSV